MTPTIVLPDGDPHMAALLSRPDFAARLDRLGGARLHADLPRDDDELVARIGDATVVILGAYLTGPVLRRLPAVKLVAFTGTGAATFIDLPTAAERGIAVANVTHYGDAAVAEHALALTLALAKHVVGNDRAVRAGEWHVGQGIELAGKTAGIVGYGGIGARFALLLEAIGLRVIAWTPHADWDRLASPAQRLVELPKLLATADVVSLHLALTDETRGLIDEPMLRSLKPGALLVNTARAELIAPGALETVLAEGRIAAALDVFETEPLAAGSPLRDLPNVVLSPHQGYNTPESLERMLDVVVANIENFLAGTPANIVGPPTPLRRLVSPERVVLPRVPMPTRRALMRSLVLSSWLSLDGYSFDPGTPLYRLLAEIDDPQQDEYFVGRLRKAGTHIMGRVTYEEMAKAWPGSDHPFAAPMNEIPKVVFSSTLASADWAGTRIARSDTTDEIARLKAEPGGDIIAHGGMAFAHSLISLGLVDEYRLWLMPAAAGDGARLFTNLTPLRLLSGRTFPSGLIELCYAPAGTN